MPHNDNMALRLKARAICIEPRRASGVDRAKAMEKTNKKGKGREEKGIYGIIQNKGHYTVQTKIRTPSCKK